MRIWWVFSFINCFLLSISAIVCYRFVDWYFVHVIKEFEGELMCGIGLHAWNMRSYFGLIIMIHWLYNYCCICMYINVPYGACILKAWQLTREYLHLTFNLEWLQVSSDSKSCWLRLTLSQSNSGCRHPHPTNPPPGRTESQLSTIGCACVMRFICFSLWEFSGHSLQIGIG